MALTRSTLPQRSPMPFMVPCTCVAPTRTAAKVLATATSHLILDVGMPLSEMMVEGASKKRKPDRGDLIQRGVIRSIPGLFTPGPKIDGILLSHAHEDHAWCRTFVESMRTAGATVWYDEHNLGYGASAEEVDQELKACPIYIIILSPASVTKSWIRR